MRPRNRQCERLGLGRGRSRERNRMSQISRREFARLAGAGGIGAWASMASSSFADRAGRSQGRDRRRRRGRGDGCPLRQEGRAGARRHADRGQPDLQLLVLLQSLSRRLPHAGVAQSRLRRPAQARRQGGARLRHRRRHRQEDRQDPGRPQLPLRPARALAGHRHQVRLHQGLFARGLRHHAARLHDGGGRQAPAQAPARRPCATAAPW